jgi:DMSO/TMAO reductase YedYZ molybdopterin-dependent catalytic subunit
MHDVSVNLSVRAGLSGVAAAAVAVGIAEVVAVGTGPLSAPLLAVGGVVVDHVPPAVKDFGVQVFGVHDKTALITGTAVLLAAYAFGLGVVARRSWPWGLGGIALFAAIGVTAAVTRHDAGVLAALPTLIGAAIAIPLLRYLLGLATTAYTPEAPNPVMIDPGSVTNPLSLGVVATTHPARPEFRSKLSTPTGEVIGGELAGGTEAGADRTGSAAAGVDGGGDGARSGRGTEDGGSSATAGGDLAGGPALVAYSNGSRRRFLKVLGVSALVAAVSGVGGRLLTSRRAVTAARNAVVLPASVAAAPTVPAGAQVSGVTPYVSSNDAFYRIDTALYPPQVDPANWTLKIHGMVRNPITISWADLLKRPMIERYVTLACVSNEVGGDLIGNALWLGTPIKALLDEAQPLPDADQVIQRSVDGWTCGSPTAVLRDGRDALLAVGMNGQPLPVDHGFPVRMVVPGLYGYVSACKWITEIELSRFADFDAYWVPRGWSQQAPIKTESRIDTPRDGAKRSAGPVTVAGVAWAQHRGIAKVEVQVDGGEWQTATLAATVSADTWRQWSIQWPATKGQHVLRVRATDTTGETQTSTPAAPAPNGATGWHSVSVTVG